ncbi:MAG: peptide ABC transporter permease [Bdellovibrionales bacterium RIFOXYD1_FULL_44_7]|nr:MAG: peptide ABC transporter permease [Bdellovibrionales bacterium RIFOXYD1_FULL_44_7]
MRRYFLRKILHSLSIIFGVALIIFTLFHVIGGDPVYEILGKYANAERAQDLRNEYGLNKPLWTQFFLYLKQIVTFDYGRSYATRQSISEILSNGIGPSLSLTLPAFVITTVLAVSISLFSAFFRGKLTDRLILLLSVLGMSVPVLAYILFGQYFLAYKLGLFPISGYAHSLGERISYLVLPVLIWIVINLGYDVRYFRVFISKELNQDYVRTARAKGLSEVSVFTKHILRNSLVPILTNVVIQIPFLILGSLLIENFFSIPGLGSVIVDAINSRDFPVIKAMTTLVSMLFIIGHLITDLLYAVVDPRIKIQ